MNVMLEDLIKATGSIIDSFEAEISFSKCWPKSKPHSKLSIISCSPEAHIMFVSKIFCIEMLIYDIDVWCLLCICAG